MGDHTISYVAPDEVTRLQSREATERFLKKNPTLDASISDFCWAGLILGFEEPTWETVHVEDQWQRHSQTQSKSSNASTLESAPDNQTSPLADVDDVPLERIDDTDASFSHFPRPHRLENTLKPNGPLTRDMSITEADNWLKGFTA